MAQHHPALRALALAVIFADGRSGAFVPPRPQSTADRFTLVGSSSNDGNGDPVFFDDFGDGYSEPDGSSSNLSSLQTRVSQVKGAEAAYDAKLARNWRRGNWSVRGFALDKSSFAASSMPASPDADVSDKPVHVSVVAAPTSSTFSDISLPQDRALPQDSMVAVGRTDGSVFVIKLGDEYLTKFASVPKLVLENEGNKEQTDANNEAEMTVRVENEWMDTNAVQKKLQEDQLGVEGSGEMADKPDPFEITHQFLASEAGEPIHSLVFHDVVENDDCDSIICTAAGSSGEIFIWTLPSADNSGGQTMQVTSLNGIHSNRIVSLKTMILQSQNVLFSASQDGTIALWNLDKNGELIVSHQCTDIENDSSVSLTCADVSNPSSWDDDTNYSSENDNDVVFLGLSNGYVMGYIVHELMSSVSNEESPVPNLRFRAHGPGGEKGEAVTAIKSGRDGTIPTSARSISRNPNLSSAILLTGGEDGSLKQWEILSQKNASSPSTTRMEHWPRLSTQRTKRRAHLFSPGHDGQVTSISQQSNDSSKIFSCSEDGSVSVWSASTGKELFRMDGFSSSISSMACLSRELLVTDGMEECVCVHDFGIEEDAAENGYDLEW